MHAAHHLTPPYEQSLQAERLCNRSDISGRIGDRTIGLW
jgi:hypothetical protein